jgi:hypothetical protein
MSEGIKIRLIEGPDGEMRVPPEVMDILICFAGHRDFCPQCKAAYDTQRPNGYCSIGFEILRRLAEQPEVTRYNTTDERRA